MSNCRPSFMQTSLSRAVESISRSMEGVSKVIRGDVLVLGSCLVVAAVAGIN